MVPVHILGSLLILVGISRVQIGRRSHLIYFIVRKG